MHNANKGTSFCKAKGSAEGVALCRGLGCPQIFLLSYRRRRQSNL